MSIKCVFLDQVFILTNPSRSVNPAEHMQPVDGGEVHLLLPAPPLRVGPGALTGKACLPPLPSLYNLLLRN